MTKHSSTWTDDLHGRIANAIRQARQGRLTAQQLADETTRLGYPVSRATLASYESGRKRHLDVSELMVVAEALQMSPMALLFPGEPDQPVEVLPDRVVSTLEASTWFVGDPDWLVTLRGQITQLARALPVTLSATDIRMGQNK